MIADITWLRERFSHFNALCFGGNLPVISMRISRSRTRWGSFRYPAGSKVSPASLQHCVLSISGCFNAPEALLEDVLLHEMIHYALWLCGRRDATAHGPNFRSLMDSLNREHNRNITISVRSGSHNNVSQSGRRNFICVMTLLNGAKAFAVCAASYAPELHRILTSGRARQVQKVEWVFSTHPWFSNYPRVRTPKYFLLTPEEYNAYILTATPLVCDGRSLYAPGKE